jgi:hypothetical protein
MKIGGMGLVIVIVYVKPVCAIFCEKTAGKNLETSGRMEGYC